LADGTQIPNTYLACRRLQSTRFQVSAMKWYSLPPTAGRARAARRRESGGHMNRLAMLSVPILLAAMAGTSVAASPGPMDRVKQDVGAVVAILKDKNVEREMRWSRISDILRNRIDFQTMSQRILAANWQLATDEEKEKFMEYFSQYLEGVYRDKIEAYTDQRIEYVHEILAEDRAVCDTVIVTSTTRIPISYRMKQNDGDWYIYDVVIEGLSLVNNYRSTYAEKVQTDGMQGLLADLQSQIEQYRADYLMQAQ
jgi:phospholipid transport system substrate-binding protein